MSTLHSHLSTNKCCHAGTQHQSLWLPHTRLTDGEAHICRSRHSFVLITCMSTTLKTNYFTAIDDAVPSRSGFPIQAQTRTTAAQSLLNYLREQIPAGMALIVLIILYSLYLEYDSPRFPPVGDLPFPSLHPYDWNGRICRG